MFPFDPNLSLKENWQNADLIDFAAWDFAGEEYRESFRDSGQFEERSAWLIAERLRLLKDALAQGELIALGIVSGDPAFAVVQIPENAFQLNGTQIDRVNSEITASGLEFLDARICRANSRVQSPTIVANSRGRPNFEKEVLAAIDTLKHDKTEFAQLKKSAQNQLISEKAAELFPLKFYGNHRIGDSTIRRYRRKNPEWFA